MWEVLEGTPLTQLVWLGKAKVIYSSGARPRVCEWRGDKQQIRRASAASFPLRPASPAAQPVTDLPEAATEGRRRCRSRGDCNGSSLPPARAEPV